MRNSSLPWLFGWAFVAVTALAVAGAEWYILGPLQSALLRDQAEQAKAQARALAAQASGLDAVESDRLCGNFGRPDLRCTVADGDGRVIADSEHDPYGPRSVETFTEIKSARKGIVLAVTRWDASLGEEMTYAAAPMYGKGGVVGFARVGAPTAGPKAPAARAARDVAIGGGVLALIALAFAVHLARRLRRQFDELRRSLGTVSGGVYQPPETDIFETGALAGDLETVMTGLLERLARLTTERNERDAVLASMIEGVIAVDTDHRILAANRTAEGLLAVDAAHAAGRPVEEAVRNPDLHRFLDAALESDGESHGELVVRDPEERILQATGAPLRDGSDVRIGTLVVLNDITRLRRLERIRRDFVANVSHELKTPISAIRGAVETLVGGAADSPEDLRRFLDMIGRHADRIHAIIEDLLSLARLEESAQRPQVGAKSRPLGPVLAAAVDDCAREAEKVGVELLLSCPEELAAPVNPTLFEQAIGNLVGNAVRFSERGGRVWIEATRDDGWVEVRVRDEGCGIEERHLPRIFERFYRADTARSRGAGGTGLGLAIVKHIVQIHRGEVTVKSAPGQGSTFTIRLPAFQETSLNRELTMSE